MKDFKKTLREVNYYLDSIFLFEAILSSVVVFLVFYLVLTFFDYHPLYSAVPAGIFLVVKIYVRFSADKLRIVESKYSELNEMLRTARDNISVENDIVNELQKDVVSKMNHVRLSSFLNSKKFSYRIFASIFFSFLIILISIFGINIKVLQPVMENLPMFFGNKTGLRLSDLDEPLNKSDDIYGKDSVATLGDSQVNIKIKPSTFDVNVREEGSGEVKEFYESFPSEIYVEKTGAYEESIPQEQQELVKNYFKKLSN